MYWQNSENMVCKKNMPLILPALYFFLYIVGGFCVIPKGNDCQVMPYPKTQRNNWICIINKSIILAYVGLIESCNAMSQKLLHSFYRKLAVQAVR